MAVEISAVIADRHPAPDWSAAGAAARYAMPAARLLAALDAGELPAIVFDGLQRLAAAGLDVAVLVAADRGSVQLMVDGRRQPLAGSARDTVLELLGEAARNEAGATPVLDSASAPDLASAARAALVGAQLRESLEQPSEPEALPAAAEPAPLSARIAEPLIGSGPSREGSRVLADAVELSGLFLESHLAQWLRGDRSLDQIKREAERLEAQHAAADGEAGEHRGSMQLDALQRQTISLAGQAWAGQPVRIDIERDRARQRDAANAGDATGLFTARLTMRLPNLGEIQARIRVIDHTVGVQIESHRAEELAAHHPALAAALAARGLHVAQIEATVPGSTGA
jgi:hypothetical protein